MFPLALQSRRAINLKEKILISLCVMQNDFGLYHLIVGSSHNEHIIIECFASLKGSERNFLHAPDGLLINQQEHENCWEELIRLDYMKRTLKIIQTLKEDSV